MATPIYGNPALDTDPDLAFDSLTRMAAHAFGVPVAILSLSGNNQLWFFSSIPMDLPALERKIAFLSHSIVNGPDPVVIDDLTLDRRFHLSPLVTSAPHLRFYACAPVICRTGKHFGHLILADTSARQFTPNELESFNDFARVARSCIESLCRLTELKSLALTDPLTQLPNRLSFRSSLDAQFRHSRRHGHGLAVLLMDVHGLHDVKAIHGHAAADEVLVEVARRMSLSVRAPEMLARTGPEAFTVLLRTGDERAARLLSSRLEEAAARPITLTTGVRVSIRLLCGFAEAADDVASPTDLLHLADLRLHGARPTIPSVL